jgi:hypothetical protein
MGLGLSGALSQPWCDAWLLTLKARCLSAFELRSPADPRASTHSSEVEVLLRRALEIARAQGAVSYELRAASVLAEHLHTKQRSAEAAEVLTAALARFDPKLSSAELDRARSLIQLLG